jgi:hypothetical protein
LTTSVAAPEKVRDLALEGQTPPTTPEEVGDIAQMLVIHEIEVAALREFADIQRLVMRGQTQIPTEWAKSAQILRGLKRLTPAWRLRFGKP